MNSIFDWIAPMKSGIGLPDDQEGWAAELKWDGLRANLATDGQRVMIRSSSGRDVSAQFPELAALGPHIGAAAVLDGELVVFDGDRPAFTKVLQRLNVSGPSPTLLATCPVVFVAFDLLALDGNRLDGLPYRTRRRLLGDLVEETPVLRAPPYVEGGAEQLLELARARQLEGIMVKHLDSRYQAGGRTNDWRKIKVRLRQEFVVGGWLPGQGSLADDIGSLVLGVWDGPHLLMAGLAGSGLRDDHRRLIAERLTTRATSPFSQVAPLDKPPVWVEPDLVAEVEFSEWPIDGYLRHPVFVGVRPDADPTDVTREFDGPGAHQ